MRLAALLGAYAILLIAGVYALANMIDCGSRSAVAIAIGASC